MESLEQRVLSGQDLGYGRDMSKESYIGKYLSHDLPQLENVKPQVKPGLWHMIRRPLREALQRGVVNPVNAQLVEDLGWAWVARR